MPNFATSRDYAAHLAKRNDLFQNLHWVTYGVYTALEDMATLSSYLTIPNHQSATSPVSRDEYVAIGETLGKLCAAHKINDPVDKEPIIKAAQALVNVYSDSTVASELSRNIQYLFAAEALLFLN